jgi:hypothetical protein
LFCIVFLDFAVQLQQYFHVVSIDQNGIAATRFCHYKMPHRHVFDVQTLTPRRVANREGTHAVKTSDSLTGY